MDILKNGITLTTTEEFVLKNDLVDIEQWVKDALRGKINNCKKRILAEWMPILLADPTVTSMPATEDAIIALIVARHDYKNRVARDGKVNNVI